MYVGIEAWFLYHSTLLWFVLFSLLKVPIYVWVGLFLCCENCWYRESDDQPFGETTCFLDKVKYGIEMIEVLRSRLAALTNSVSRQSNPAHSYVKCTSSPSLTFMLIVLSVLHFICSCSSRSPLILLYLALISLPHLSVSLHLISIIATTTGGKKKRWRVDTSLCHVIERKNVDDKRVMMSQWWRWSWWNSDGKVTVIFEGTMDQTPFAERWRKPALNIDSRIREIL